MIRILTLIVTFAFLVPPSLNRTLWEPSIPEVSAPFEDDTPIELKKYQPKLQITFLKGNLGPIYFTNLRNVSELRIIKNQIRQIEPGALCPSKALKILELDLSGNKNPPVLTKSTFDNCNLEELFLKFDYNNPSEIHQNALEELKDLKVLGVDSLRVKHLKKGFLTLGKNLTSLVLSNIHVETIDANVLDDLSNLEEIEIVQNVELEHIPEGLFKKCAKLKRLNLKDNGIKNISWNEFEGLSTLEELNLADNRIENFDADKIVKNMPKLKMLSMVLNPIGCKKEEEFVRALNDKFRRTITVSTNKNNLLC